MNLINKVNNYRTYIGYASTFKEDEEFKVLNLEFEYSGYSGLEKFAIATDLTESDLYSKYGEEIRLFEPFILLTRDMGMTMVEHHKNDEKFRTRARRGQEVLVEEIFDEFYADESIQAEINTEIRNDLILVAVNKLSKKNRERIISKFYYGKTDQEIALDSGCDRSTVSREIRNSIKKMRKMLVEMGVCA